MGSSIKNKTIKKTDAEGESIKGVLGGGNQKRQKKLIDDLCKSSTGDGGEVGLARGGDLTKKVEEEKLGKKPNKRKMV